MKKYLRSCRPSPDADSKKDTGRLPNLAGFCASLGCGTASVSRLREAYPQHYDYLCAVMEDEVLNSARSPALLNSYLKERLGYGDKGSTESTEQIPLPIFEHDILEDGE